MKSIIFYREFERQKKLADNHYEIVLRPSNLNDSVIFNSAIPFDENLINHFLPGYQLTVEYEIVDNQKCFKPGGEINIVEAQRKNKNSILH